jgi:hypothetical protein
LEMTELIASLAIQLCQLPFHSLASMRTKVCQNKNILGLSNTNLLSAEEKTQTIHLECQKQTLNNWYKFGATPLPVSFAQ